LGGPMAQRLDHTLLGRELGKSGSDVLRRSKEGVAPRAQSSLQALRRRLPPMAQRAARRLPNSAVRRLASEEEFTVSAEFQQDLEAQRGKGHPLDASVAASMGSSLGADVSGVRIHTDEVSDRMADSIQARAFAQGKDLYFAHGEFDPHSESGRYTLAHELAHATDTEDRPASAASGRTVVGAANDPAEARADAAAQSAVSALRRQTEADEEEEEALPLRRQIEPEEEKEEPIQTLRRQVEGDEEEEELQPLRRRVTVDVITQTITEDAVQQMTILELREQLERLQTGIAISDVRESNQPLIEAELARREAELEAATIEELDRQCGRELDRLRFWLASTGGLPLQTLRAYDGAVGNFVDATEATSAGGVQFADVFGVVLALVPGVGPVAKWVGDQAVRAAMVAAAQAAAGAAASRVPALTEEARGREEREARLGFAAGVRAESAVLADTLARNADSALTTYENAVDTAHRSRDIHVFRSLLINLQHENDEVRSVDPAQYNELSRRFEIELYRRHYSTRAYIHEYRSDMWGVHSRDVRGIPDDVQAALRGRLRAARSMLELARAWGLRTEVTETSGGRF
ncbi:MAG: DUF4157 domain-containing protein, partial [Anaerolineae bacterium]